MAQLVETVDDVIKNVLTLEDYRQGRNSERRFRATRIKNGKLFVALKHAERWLFAPSKFAGYQNNDTSHELDLDNRDVRVTNERMTKIVGDFIDKGNDGYSEIDRAFIEFCRQSNIVPSRHSRARRYWIIDETKVDHGKLTLADEAPDDMFEGGKQAVFVNRYERDPRARRQCIAHYGCDCAVCGFNFEIRYGQIGREYIHVHHLVPISSIGRRYKVDPIKDLRPVCANCHAMLHQGKTILAIEDLRERLRQT